MFFNKKLSRGQLCVKLAFDNNNEHEESPVEEHVLDPYEFCDSKDGNERSGKTSSRKTKVANLPEMVSEEKVYYYLQNMTECNDQDEGIESFCDTYWNKVDKPQESSKNVGKITTPPPMESPTTSFITGTSQELPNSDIISQLSSDEKTSYSASVEDDFSEYSPSQKNLNYQNSSKSSYETMFEGNTEAEAIFNGKQVKFFISRVQ